MFYKVICIVTILTYAVYGLPSQDVGAGECLAVDVSPEETIGLVKMAYGYYGLCENKKPIIGMKACQGYCSSSVTYNRSNERYDSACTACRAMTYITLPVQLDCESGSEMTHHIHTPGGCTCRPCDDTWQPEVPKVTPKITGVNF